MKQKGDIWTDHKGQEVPKEYVKQLSIIQERFAQQILGILERINGDINELRNRTSSYLDKNMAEDNKSITINSFDRSIKIVVDTAPRHDCTPPYILVYQATKENPSTKDYKLINPNINIEWIKNDETQEEDETSQESTEENSSNGTVYNDEENGSLLSKESSDKPKEL